jgi:predicted nucleic acid-binding protein
LSLIIFLDTGPLGLATNPNKDNGEAIECTKWLISCLNAGARVCVPEICDYELRRELLRAHRTCALTRLDQLKHEVDYVPITTAMMRKAAEYWAEARNAHKPTAPKEALDGDVILAAQAALSAEAGDQVVIATENVGHLSMFTQAKRWKEISPT